MGKLFPVAKGTPRDLSPTMIGKFPQPDNKQEGGEIEAQPPMEEQADTQLDAAKLELEKEKLATEERIAGAKIGANASLDNRKIEAQELMEGTKMGMQAVQQQADLKLREKESRMRDETAAHKQKLKDKTEIKETKDEDNTN